MARRWTEEERRRQSEAIRRWAPWEHSTGARSPETRAICARNSYKTGLHSAEMRRWRKLLAGQRILLADIRRKLKT